MGREAEYNCGNQVSGLIMLMVKIKNVYPRPSLIQVPIIFFGKKTPLNPIFLGKSRKFSCNMSRNMFLWKKSNFDLRFFCLIWTPKMPFLVPISRNLGKFLYLMSIFIFLGCWQMCRWGGMVDFPADGTRSII